MKKTPVVLAYSGCSTCKKALAWLAAKGVPHEVRAIVDEPPTKRELAVWIPASGKPVRKWLNTSGLSYRAIGKETIERSSDAELVGRLAADGKLVKRPVLVRDDLVLVGFDAGAWNAALG